MATHKKYIPMYRVYLIYTDTPFDGIDTNCYGGAVRRIGNKFEVYLPHDDGSFVISDIAHEAFHAADFIAEYVGMEYKEGSGNEHVAYLIGFIVDFILDCGHKICKKAK